LAIARSSVSTHGSDATLRAALTSTAGNPDSTTADAMRWFSIRAMTPSPRQRRSHRGGSSPRPCSPR
jgi:hypothetical protein